MNRVILSASTDETILAVTRQHKLVDLEIEQQINTEIVGCIYKGVVKNIVPAVDGIFVDIGIGKNAFLRRKDLLNEKRFPTEGRPYYRKDQYVWKVCSDIIRNRLYRSF